MEDRINSGLLFVLIDRAADAALGDWDERLRGLPGVAGISWWKNVQLNRADWLGELRTVEDFEMLGICEIDGAVVLLGRFVELQVSIRGKAGAAVAERLHVLVRHGREVSRERQVQPDLERFGFELKANS